MRMRKVLVTFTPEQYECIQRVKPEVGLRDADTVRTIVVNWLLDRGYLGRPSAQASKKTQEPGGDAGGQ